MQGAHDHPENQASHEGEEMTEKTLRDEFAMAALTGLLSNPNGGFNPFQAAVEAYGFADAMMREREE
jgi:hypothetical protein